VPRHDGQTFASTALRRSFGRWLKDVRRGLGFSQAAIAKAAGVSSVFVSQIESGQRVPSDRVARAIAEALALPRQEVLQSVYTLRSQDGGDLFSGVEQEQEPIWRSISDIPGFRFLLLQLSELKLSGPQLDILISNWQNDVALLRSRPTSVEQQ
jgi:transcriptional regulator with XRE-family HTH domain